MFLTDNYIRSMFARHIYERGVQYFMDGLVDIVHNGESQLEAEVHGAELYIVQIEESRNGLSYYCSCPYDGPCKHVAAVLLAAAEVETNGYHHIEVFSAGDKKSPWRRYFSELDHFEPSPGQVSDWRILYEFALDGQGWSLHPKKQKILKDGSFGKPQAISSSDFSKTGMIDSPDDKLVLSFLEKWRLSSANQFYYYTVRANKYDFKFATAAGLLFRLLRERPLFWAQTDDSLVPLDYHPQPGKIKFRLVEQNEELIFSPFLILDDREAQLRENFTVLTGEPVWLIFEDKLVEIEGNLRAQSLLPFTRPVSEVTVKREQLPDFFNSLASAPDVFSAFDFPENVHTETLTDFDEKRLYVSELHDGICVRPKFNYGPVEMDATDTRAIGWGMRDDNTYVKVVRNLAAENEAMEELLKSNLKRTAGGVIRTYKNKAFDWLLGDVPQLVKKEFVLFGEEKLKRFQVNRATPQLRVQIKSDIDWFDLEIEIDFGGVLLSLQEIKRALKKKNRYVKLTDGSTAAIPENWLSKFKHTVNLGEEAGSQVRLSHFHVTLIDELFAEAHSRKDDQLFRDRLQRLKSFSGIKTQSVPDSLNGTLRPYQKDGYNWLQFLRDYQFGGCLADDMGLGKTIQALTILLAEHEKGAGPSLIVAPTSVIFNWLDEIQRFAPVLRVFNQTGSDRQRVDVDYAKYDIVLTSYGTLRQDIIFLKEVQFNLVILDESQNIKNPLSQTAKAAKLLKSKQRLALTGTPIENNTTELWSLFSFLNPGLLGSLNYYKEAFAKPIEKEQDEEVAKLLRQTVYPFILRRTKDKVAKELPPKTENTIITEMSTAQEKVYNKWRDYYRAALLKQIADVGLNQSRMNVLEGLTRLRQIACHPELIESGFTGNVSKYDTLMEYLTEITAEGHKVLVFSQFVRMLTLIRRYLDGKKIKYAYLDGQTRDRKSCVEQFENDKACKLFLISLKAGGTGLNLTAADYVIHYDPWWNPSVEAQATDRSHRIGQDKHVFVYKMISKGTVEEKILQLQKRKRDLVSSIITMDVGLFKKLDVEDIEALFS